MTYWSKSDNFIRIERAQIEALAGQDCISTNLVFDIRYAVWIGVLPSVTNREQLMQEIVTCRKLVDTIKAQDEALL